MPSYVRFTECDPPTNRKTKVWEVTSTGGSHLGDVAWWPAWRCYCFFPEDPTIFNSGCMRDIAKFMDEKMEEHRNALAQSV